MEHENYAGSNLVAKVHDLTNTYCLGTTQDQGTNDIDRLPTSNVTHR